MGNSPATGAELHGRLIRRVEVVRLAFGLVWAIDAYLKWQPALPTATGAWSVDHVIERRLPTWTRIAEPGGKRGRQPVRAMRERRAS